jgi:multiple sugar transport system permease protein
LSIGRCTTDVYSNQLAGRVLQAQFVDGGGCCSFIALLFDVVLFHEKPCRNRNQYWWVFWRPTNHDCVKVGNPEEDCLKRPIVYNYTAAFKEAPLVRYMLNGVFVTVSIFIIQVIIALPCAYALSKLRFWGRNVVFGMVIFCLLIPVHAIALPLYIMLAKVGLTNTYAALIVPWSISVFGIFLMRQFFMTVPDDLIDAARMDGMSEFSIVWQVMLPTAVPALLAFGIFSVVAHWNDYYWPRVVITGNKDLMTPPLGLRMFKSDMDGNEYGPMMAATTVIVLPLVIIFLLAQRRFIEGITMTGMK